MAEMSKTIETILTADSSQLRTEFAKAEKMTADYERKVAQSQSLAKSAALDNVRALQLEATGRKAAAEAMRQEITLKAEARRLSAAAGISEQGAIGILRRKLELETRISQEKARAARIAGGGLGLPLMERDLNREWELREKTRSAAVEQRRASTGLAGAYGGLRSAIVPVAAGLYAVNRAGAVVTDLFSTFAEREKMTLGMESIMGSATAAKKRLEELRIIAAAPGLNVAGVIGGDVRLQSSGFSAQESAEALKQFGNALALVGGGEAELKGVVLALGQISSKGKVSAEEINQIAERLPQVRLAMQRAFGTADTELLQKMGIDAKTFINGITEALAALPRATGGASDAMMKANDAWTDFKASLGQVIAIPGVPVLEEATKTLKEFQKVAAGESADWSKIMENTTVPGLAQNAFGSLVGFVEKRVTGEEKITLEAKYQAAARERQEKVEQSMLSMRDRELSDYYARQELDQKRVLAERQIAAEAQKRLEIVKETNDVLRSGISQSLYDQAPAEKQLAVLRAEAGRLQKEAERAQALMERTSGRQGGALADPAAIAAAADAARARGDYGQEKTLLEFLQRILEIKGRIAELEKQSGERAAREAEVEKQKQEAAKSKADAVAKEAAEKAKSQQESRTAFAQDMAVLGLQAQGRADAAEALKKEISLRREAVDMAEKMGITEEQALEALRKREALLRRGEEAERPGGRRSNISRPGGSRTDFARGNNTGFSRGNRVGFAREQMGLRDAAAAKALLKDPAAKDRAAAANYYDESLKSQQELVAIFNKLGIA
jgi:tape measure domain-containing protein